MPADTPPTSTTGATARSVADQGRADLQGLATEPGVKKKDPILVADSVSRRFGGLTAVDVAHV